MGEITKEHMHIADKEDELVNILNIDLIDEANKDSRSTI